jgi:hypothetical protein
MAVYMHTPARYDGVDGPRCFHGREFSHLSADTEEELRAYAFAVCLPLRWLQDAGTPSFHFDVTGQWLKFCLQDHAVEKIDRREFIQRLRAKRGEPRTAEPPVPEAGSFDFESGGEAE